MGIAMTTEPTPQKRQTALDLLFSAAGHRYGRPTITRLAKIAGVVPKTVYAYPDVVAEFKRRRELATEPRLVDWESECRRRSADFQMEIRTKNKEIKERQRERDAAYQRIHILEFRLIDAESKRIAGVKKMNDALKVSAIH
ncbi:hypothetical protein ABH924_003652 [Arthrobacter sp. GAS37]|uniref:hypothetical protein n=1 Tax=Arthrobacter sp. GAS37 TaxID=3156261 RepID=UPI003838FDE0